MKQFLSFLLVVCLLGAVTLGIGVACYFGVKHWEERPRYLERAVEIDLTSSMPLRKLGAKLSRKGLIDSSFLFYLWVRATKNYNQFQAGHYRFEGAITPNLLADTFISGKVYNPIVYKLTIPEGSTFKEIASKASSLGAGSLEEYYRLFEDKVFISSLSINSHSLEGFIYPATYDFIKVPEPKELLARCVDVFWDKLPKNYVPDILKLGLSLEQAVTFASLIELETPHDSERTFVSEVIWNRLKQRMPLGIDAALIYGIKDFQGNITQAHLEDRSNLYNTRLHPGLPPGPIGSPSTKSLQAVINPSSFGYLYYVVDPELGNFHHFSHTLAEHNKYVRKLITHQRNLK